MFREVFPGRVAFRAPPLSPRSIECFSNVAGSSTVGSSIFDLASEHRRAPPALDPRIAQLGPTMEDARSEGRGSRIL
eukprot:8044179-Pyramimonas_sp.AAC.1